MLVQLLALYLFSVVFFLKVGLTDDIRRFREVLAVIGTSITWPAYHIPWHDHRPGRHRAPRHNTTGHSWVGWQVAGHA
jgi:hypothetical protein